MIDDPPGIAPTGMARDTAKRSTQSASASSATRPIAPQLGATPAGHTAGADALDEKMVRAMIDSCGHSTQDKE
eukprot:6400266-Pyramimonas_sp.AAC.1